MILTSFLSFSAVFGMDQNTKTTKLIDLGSLRGRYWLKLELINYCASNGLVTSGSKNELLERIEVFLVSGKRLKSELSKQIGKRDSLQSITHDTLVVNYKNDAATRLFFVENIGEHFRFDAYLRQFTNPDNITENLTYGDLINGWLAEEVRRNDPAYQSDIGKQFEYNQFIRDFFANEKGKSRSDAIKAWQTTKALNGPTTYAQYQATLLERKES